MPHNIPIAIKVPGPAQVPVDPRLRVLQRCKVFGALSDVERRKLADMGVLVRMEKGRDIADAQDEALYVVGGGHLRCVYRGEERDVTLGYVGPGELAGEMKLQAGTNDTTFEILEYLDAVRIPVRVLRDLMHENGKFAEAMFALMAERRNEIEERFKALLTRSVESRIAEFLLSAIEEHGVPDPEGVRLGGRFSHQDIANYVGSTRETVTLVLGELKKAGILETGHRKIVVRKRDELRLRVSQPSIPPQALKGGNGIANGH